MVWLLYLAGIASAPLASAAMPPPGDDLTPEVGSPTDVARLSHQLPKPQHELTAEEERGAVNWNQIAEMPSFRELLRRKARFIVPATVFFIVYYFLLPILVGYAPALMDKKVLGPVNIAYLFALSQFFVVWILAALYVRAAAGFDKEAAAVLAEHDQQKGVA